MSSSREETYFLILFISLMIFCLLFLSIIEHRVLNSPMITVEFCFSFQFCHYNNYKPACTKKRATNTWSTSCTFLIDCTSYYKIYFIASNSNLCLRLFCMYCHCSSVLGTAYIYIYIYAISFSSFYFQSIVSWLISVA